MQREKVFGIEYTTEFRSWLEDQDGHFTIPDFHRYMEEKFPGKEISRNSVRSPVREAEKNGDLVVVTKGHGRAATVYAKKAQLLPVERAG